MLKWAIVASGLSGKQALSPNIFQVKVNFCFRQIAFRCKNWSFFKQTSVSCIRGIAKRSALRVHRAEHVRPSNNENDQKCEKQQSRNELSLLRSLIGGRRSGCRHGRRRREVGRTLSCRLQIWRRLTRRSSGSLPSDQVLASLSNILDHLRSWTARFGFSRSELQRLTLVIIGIHVIQSQVFVLFVGSVVFYDLHFWIWIRGISVLQRSLNGLHQLLKMAFAQFEKLEVFTRYH